MKNIDVDYINTKLLEKGDSLFKLADLEYPCVKTDGVHLLDRDGKPVGTKGDMYAKVMMDKLLREGCYDINPRPKYETDFKPANTLSLNNPGLFTYDISKGESPMITLRPIAVKKSIGEVLWIYQDATTNLDVLKDKYGVTWWDEWDLKGDDGIYLRDIGSTYGSIISHYKQMDKLISDLKENPDSRRHIIDMWQLEDFKKPHGLKPCAYSTVWNVRHGRDGVDYLDMKLIQRSSDFLVAGCINQMQYLALMQMVAQSTGYKPGTFSWDLQNVQIYDRHIAQAVEQLRRDPINCFDGVHQEPYLELNPNICDFYDFTVDDISVKNYPRQLIKTINPQQKFDKGI